MPFRGYKLSLSTSLAKFGSDAYKVFKCERKASNLIRYFLLFYFYLYTFSSVATGWLQTIVLLTFSYVKER